MDSLSKAQKYVRILKIIVLVTYILSIVAIFCTSLLLVLSFFPAVMDEISKSLIEEGEVALSQNFQAETLLTFVSILSTLVIEFFTLKYLNMELKDGTPYTHDGANLLEKTAKITIMAPLVAYGASAIIVAAYGLKISSVPTSIAVSTILFGMLLMALAHVFRHGARSKN